MQMTRKSSNLFLLLTAIYIMGVGKLDVAADTKYPIGKNYPILSNLCRLYLTAKEPPLPAVENATTIQEGQKMSLLAAAMVEDDWFQAAFKADDVGSLPTEIKDRYQEYSSNWDFWKPAIQTFASQKEIVRLNGTNLAFQVGRARMEKLANRFQQVMQHLSDFSKDSRRAKIVADLRSAALGAESASFEAGKLKTTGNLQATRKNSCGASLNSEDAGAQAGEALTSDMMCLCAPAGNSDEGGNKWVCGHEVGGAGSDGSGAWAASGTSINDILPKVLKACNETHTSKATNVQELRGLLLTFLRDAGTGIICDAGGASAQVSVPNGLGFFRSDSACAKTSAQCDGVASASDGGVCVYYGAGKTAEGIAWYKKFTEAAKLIEELEKKAEELNREKTIATLILTRAEEIYEETKSALDHEKATPENLVQGGTKRQNPPTPTDKMASQEPNSVNTATLPPVILPWTLLI